MKLTLPSILYIAETFLQENYKKNGESMQYNFNKCGQLRDIMHKREKLKGNLTKNVTEILKLHFHVQRNILSINESRK